MAEKRQILKSAPVVLPSTFVSRVTTMPIWEERWTLHISIPNIINSLIGILALSRLATWGRRMGQLAVVVVLGG